MPPKLLLVLEGAAKGLEMDTAELLDVLLNHAGTLSTSTLARLAVCSREFQRIVRLHVKVCSITSI
jgi:hypothetical protein